MKLMTLMTCALMSGLFCASPVHAATARDLGSLQLASSGRRASVLGELLKAPRSLLIVLDARSESSKRWVEAMSRSGFEGERSIVLLIHATEAERDAYETLARWPLAQWRQVDAMSMFKATGLNGTPAVFAVEGSRVRWRVSGHDATTMDALHLRLLDWLGEASPKTSAKP